MTWQPIETAPKDRTEILVYSGQKVWPDGMGWSTGSKKIQIVRWSGWGGGVWEPYSGHSGGISDEPTHWMHIPQPPVEYPPVLSTNNCVHASGFSSSPSGNLICPGCGASPIISTKT